MGESHAASTRYGIACRVCGAMSHEPCRTLRTGRVTDTHKCRINDWLERRALTARPAPSGAAEGGPR